MRNDVLHVVSSNRRRGAETFGYDLHCALAEQGVRSDICCIAPGDGESPLPVPALANRRFSVAGMRNLRRRSGAANVVVAHGSSTLLACGLGLVGLELPFIYKIIGDPRYWASSPARRTRARWLIRRAAAVVVTAPSARDVVAGHYRLDPERVHVIPNGRSAGRFAQADAAGRAAARRTLGLPEAADVVVVVGALSPEKRVDLAIAAVSRLPNTVLVVAGDGPERPKLEAMAERSAPSRVHFLGATEGPDTVLAAADVLALSSDSEGFPGVLIEAGLAGLPVVATDVGWIRDVVRDGETGLLVPRGMVDEFAAAARDALSRRARLGAAARAHCLAEFEMVSITDKWRRLIKNTAGLWRAERG